MNIKDLKLSPLAKLSQVIVFQGDGSILESDDTLVKLSLKDHNVFRDTFLAGMESQAEALSSGEEVYFECIETGFFDRNAQYDFILKKLNDEVDKYALMIYDFSKQYSKIFELQQERNLAEMKITRLERKNQALADNKDLVEKLYNEQLNTTSSKHVFVKSDNLHVNIDLDTVLYFEAYGDYIKIFTPKNVYVTHSTMKNLEPKLPEANFMRIHRSFIVAIDKIKNIEQMSLLIGDKVLPISKSNKSLLLERIKHI